MSTRRQRRKKATGSSSTATLFKWLLRGFALLILLTLLGLFLGYQNLRSHLSSSEFNQHLCQKIGPLLHTDKVTLSPLQWDGWAVESKQIKATGSKKLKSLQAAQIETELDLSGLKHRTWNIGTISIREAHLDLGIPETAQSHQPNLTQSKTTKTAPPKKSSPFWNQWLPNKTVIEEFRIDRLSGTRTTQSNSSYTWKHLTLTASPAKNGYHFTAHGGNITTPLKLLPSATLIKAKARYSNINKQPIIYLQNAEFDTFENGTLTLSGEFPNGSHNLEGTLTKVRAHEIFPSHWSTHLKGEITSKFELEEQTSVPQKLTGHLILKDAVLSQLPLLDRLSAYADTTRFRRLNLSTAELDYETIGPQIKLTQINIKSKGLLQLTGQIDFNQDTREIDGTLHLGLTPGTLSSIPGAETKVFLPGKDNLHWATIRLTGTLDKIDEDLSNQMIAAAIDRMFEIIPETGEIALRHSGRLAGKSATLLLKESGKLIEKGALVAEKNLNTAAKLTNQALEKTPKLIEKTTDTTIEATETILDTGVGILNGILGGDSEKKSN